MGPIEEDSNAVYLRPETAQGSYVNFKNVQQSSRKKLPFGIAQIGKSFRNEISPGNFVFRMREFEQMEMQYFVRPDEAARIFEEWLPRRFDWYTRYGVNPARLRFREHAPDELAHYAKKAIDVEYRFPFGWKELEGIHNRGDFDLSRHQAESGENLEYFDPATEEHFVPFIVETAGGPDRSAFTFLIDSYREEEVRGEKRVVLGLNPDLAPYKVAVLPLLKKRPEIVELAHRLRDDIARDAMAVYDDTAAIGKLYRRQDEIGTPWCVCIDVESLEDGAATIRDRDTMTQERTAHRRHQARDPRQAVRRPRLTARLGPAPNRRPGRAHAPRLCRSSPLRPGRAAPRRPYVADSPRRAAGDGREPGSRPSAPRWWSLAALAGSRVTAERRLTAPTGTLARCDHRRMSGSWRARTSATSNGTTARVTTWTRSGAQGRERAEAEAWLLARAGSDWRDLEGLLTLGSDRAREAVIDQLRNGSLEQRLAAARRLPEDPAIEADRVGAIVAGLGTATVMNGLTTALDLAAEYRSRLSSMRCSRRAARRSRDGRPRRRPPALPARQGQGAIRLGPPVVHASVRRRRPEAATGRIRAAVPGVWRGLDALPGQSRCLPPDYFTSVTVRRA